MRKIQVEQIADGKILSEGKWLPVMGNQLLSEGAFVWTDGRCVYGHGTEHSPSIITTSSQEGILILEGWHGSGCRYSFLKDGKLTPIGIGQAADKLVNNRTKLELLDMEILDAQYDGQGNLYSLEHGVFYYDYQERRIVQSGSSAVKCNGKVIKTYSLEPLLEQYISEATSEAIKNSSPTAGAYPDTATQITDCYCSTIGGRVDGNGNFLLIVNASVSVSHDQYAFEEISFDPLSAVYLYIKGHVGYSELKLRLLYDGENITPWYREKQSGEYKYKTYPMDWRFDESERREVWHAPPNSISIPIHDGWSYTFAYVGDDNISQSTLLGGYEVRILSPQKNVIAICPSEPAGCFSI